MPEMLPITCEHNFLDSDEGVVKEVKQACSLATQIQELRTKVAAACQGLSKAQRKVTWKACDEEVRVMKKNFELQ
eukprot:1346246-Karenia_brevis.AAC.1